MPFSTTTEKHTELYWDNFFLKFVKPSIEKLGYSCSRSKAQPSNIIKGIFKELIDADLVLAVLTDFNANVWYELGSRHVLRKGTIMMIEEGQKLPFDISQYGVIKYGDTIAGASDFEEKLQSFIHKIAVDQPADSPAIEFLGSQTRSEYQQRIEDMETIGGFTMGRYFTVDRNRTLEEGKIINLVKYSDVEPHELQVHVDSLFPDGVTRHGEHYMLKGQTSAMGISPVIELLFEYVRRSHFPSRPSRFQSVFAFENFDQAVSFRKEYGKSEGLIWEVESDVAFKADMRLLTLKGSLLGLSYNAHQYWREIASGNNPVWEYLMVPPVRVIRRID